MVPLVPLDPSGRWWQAVEMGLAFSQVAPRLDLAYNQALLLHMNVTLTEFLAMWGATLGTLSLAWNLWTWTRGRPRVSATVEVRELADNNEISYELRNRGNQSQDICCTLRNDPLLASNDQQLRR